MSKDQIKQLLSDPEVAKLLHVSSQPEDNKTPVQIASNLLSEVDEDPANFLGY
jgi:hypothetical protein